MTVDAKLPFKTIDELRSMKMARHCGGCTACCFVIEVQSIGKPFRTKCRHVVDGQGCSIWGGPGGPGGQPPVCARYLCAWSMGFGEPEDRPDISGVLVDFRVPTRVNLDNVPAFYAIGVREGMERKKKARIAIENISFDAGHPVHLADRMMNVVETIEG